MLIVLLTAAFLAAAPWVFILGPFTLLLLISHPRTSREWLYLANGALFLAFALRTPVGLAEQVSRSGGLFFTGAFIIAALIGIRSLFTRAVVSVVVAALATIGWCASFGLRYGDLRTELTTQTWAGYRLVLGDLPAALPSPDSLVVATGPTADLVRQLSGAVTALGMFFPALMALCALGGGWLAWGWYHRLARTPIGAPPAPFRAFRFNDHLVWGLVLLLAAALSPTSDTVALVVSNALLVVVLLYAGRGLAVAQTAMFGASPLVKCILVILSVPLLLLSVGGCTILGVADTWVDFRRRLAPATGAIP